MTSDQCQGCHSAAIAPFGPTMYLPTKAGNGDQRLAVHRVALVADGAGRPRSDLLRAARQRARVPRRRSATEDAREPEADGRRHLLPLPRRDGQAPARHRSSRRDTSRSDYIQRTGSEPGAKYGALARDGISCASCHHIPRDMIPPDWKKSPLEYFLTQLDHRTLPDRPAGRDVRPVQGRRDRHRADGQRARRQAEAQRVHQERADVRAAATRSICRWSTSRRSRRSVRRPRTRSSRRRISNGSTASTRTSSARRIRRRRPARTATCRGELREPDARRRRRRRSRRASRSSRTRPIPPPSTARRPTTSASASARRASSRHELLGMNGFLLEMFRQFNDILGVRKSDYMTGTSDNLEDAQANLFEQARTRTATIAATTTIVGRDAHGERDGHQPHRPPLPERRRLPPRVHRAARDREARRRRARGLELGPDQRRRRDRRRRGAAAADRVLHRTRTRRDVTSSTIRSTMR